MQCSTLPEKTKHDARERCTAKSRNCHIVRTAMTIRRNKTQKVRLDMLCREVCFCVKRSLLQLLLGDDKVVCLQEFQLHQTTVLERPKKLMQHSVSPDQDVCGILGDVVDDGCGFLNVR